MLVGWAEEHGCARIQLQADRSNAAALAFYRTVGWEDTCLIGLRYTSTVVAEPGVPPDYPPDSN